MDTKHLRTFAVLLLAALALLSLCVEKKETCNADLDKDNCEKSGGKYYVTTVMKNPPGSGSISSGYCDCAKVAPAAVCGNGRCETGETNDNCPQDCGNSPTGCVKEGERIGGAGEKNGKQCCAGLTEVFDQWKLDGAGNCLALDNYGYYCLKCGDGNCGTGENKCNCPADCEGFDPFYNCNTDSDCIAVCDSCITRTEMSRIDFACVKNQTHTIPVCKCEQKKCVNAAACGDGICETGETASDCPQDCGGTSCYKQGQTFEYQKGACCAGLQQNYYYSIEVTYASGGGGIVPTFICVNCGDGVCGKGETAINCLQDCQNQQTQTCNQTCVTEGYAKGDLFPTPGGTEPCVCKKSPVPVCGNGNCETGETSSNCPQDCAKTTADCVQEGGLAGSGGHGGPSGPQCCPGLSQISSSIVPNDAGGCSPMPAGFVVCSKCGDGICGKYENYCNCPQDCKLKDHAENTTGCAGEGEDPHARNCCPGLAMIMNSWMIDDKGVCVGFDMPTEICIRCGDGICGKGENKCNCPQDCVQPKTDCSSDDDCVSDGATCHQCFNKAWFMGEDIQIRSNGFKCQGVGDSLCSCKQGNCVVTSICGNGNCENGETATNCPQDCSKGTAVCGNGICEEGESTSCPQDCEPHKAVCGDGICQGGSGEDDLTCPQDCKIQAACGNGFCEKGEDTSRCPQDCGTR